MIQKKWPFFICIFIISLITIDIFFGKKNDEIIGFVAPPPNSDAIGMPLVQDSSPAGYIWGDPKEQRGPDVRKWLAPSLKISVSGSSGSGTIIYYDETKNEAYVISCGHLWSGTKSAEDVAKNPVRCKVITWYHNLTKLDSPKTYDAQVLFWSNNRGWDCSLLKFKPDWVPIYYPIAPVDYKITPGMRIIATGCDGGREVALYDTEFVEYRGNDLITKKNSPRPGRSGGGNFTEDNLFVGITWGTSDTHSGGGIGYITPLKSISTVYERNGFGWLLKISDVWARKIPIIDRNNPQGQYPKDYVPLPQNNFPIPRY